VVSRNPWIPLAEHLGSAEPRLKMTNLLAVTAMQEFYDLLLDLPLSLVFFVNRASDCQANGLADY